MEEIKEYFLNVDYELYKRQDERFEKQGKGISWLGAFSTILGK